LTSRGDKDGIDQHESKLASQREMRQKQIADDSEESEDSQLDEADDDINAQKQPLSANE